MILSTRNPAQAIVEIEEKSLLPDVGDAMLVVAGTAERPGWMAADGREVSRAGYRALYARTGDSNGPGDGSTTFNILDCTSMPVPPTMVYAVRVR